MRQELFQDVIDAVNAGYTSILFIEELDDQQLLTLNQTLEAQGIVIDEIILYALGSNIIEFIRPIVRNINKIRISDKLTEEAIAIMKGFFPENMSGRVKMAYSSISLKVDDISSSGIKLLFKALTHGYMQFDEINIHRDISSDELELLKNISNNGFILPDLSFGSYGHIVELSTIKSILKSKILYNELNLIISQLDQEWESFLSEIKLPNCLQTLCLSTSKEVTYLNFLTANHIKKLISKINNISTLHIWDRADCSQEGCLDPLFEYLNNSNNKIKTLSLSEFSAEKSLFSKLPVNNLYELSLFNYSDSRLHDQLLPQITLSKCRLEVLQISNFAQRDDFLLKNSIQFYQKLVSGPIYLKHFNYSRHDENFDFPYELVIKLLHASCQLDSKLETLSLTCKKLNSENIDQVVEIIKHPNFKLKLLTLPVEEDILSKQHLVAMADSSLLYFNDEAMPIVEQLLPAAKFIYNQKYNNINSEGKYQAYIHLWDYIEYRDSITYIIQRENLKHKFNKYTRYEEDPKLTKILLEHYFHIMKVLPEEYDPLFVEVGSGDNKTYIGFKQNKLLEHNSETILFALPLEIRMLITEYILAAPKAAPSPEELITDTQHKVDDSDLYHELAGTILDIGE
jgi:hypothetical protein